MGMSVPEPRRFPTASAYGNSDSGSFVSANQQPLFIPPEQFASLDTPSADPNAPSAANQTTVNLHSFRRSNQKFFGDMDIGDNGMPVGRGRRVNSSVKNPNPTGPGQQYTQNGLY